MKSIFRHNKMLRRCTYLDFISSYFNILIWLTVKKQKLNVHNLINIFKAFRENLSDDQLFVYSNMVEILWFMVEYSEKVKFVKYASCSWANKNGQTKCSLDPIGTRPQPATPIFKHTQTRSQN